MPVDGAENAGGCPIDELLPNAGAGWVALFVAALPNNGVWAVPVDDAPNAGGCALLPALPLPNVRGDELVVVAALPNKVGWEFPAAGVVPNAGICALLVVVALPNVAVGAFEFGAANSDVCVVVLEAEPNVDA